MKSPSIKLVLSVVLILLGASLAYVATNNTGSSNSSEGIIIDFGGRDIDYVSVSDGSDTMYALEYACQLKGYELEVDGHDVSSINGLPLPEDNRKWNLFLTEKGETSWKRSTADPSSVIIGDYSAVSWGLCTENETPTPGVDATGYNYYVYPQATRVISLAPSCTETICAVGGINTIIGTDQYSNYPHAVVEKQMAGDIAIVGGYTNPSYELIIQQNPDLVVCIDGQASHLIVAEKLRNVGINVVVSFDGESIDTILDNTHMIGFGMGYTLSLENTLEMLETGLNDIHTVLAECFQLRYPSVMVSLSTVKSPWVSGSNTYVSDILNFTFCINSYEHVSGWVQINSETIVQYNPSYIIVVSAEYSPTEEDYQKMMDGLSKEWKSTDAYKTGNIFIYTESAADLASRPATRVAQLTEILSRTLHPEAFDDGIQIPKYIGDNYTDFLTYTKDMGFNGGSR